MDKYNDDSFGKVNSKKENEISKNNAKLSEARKIANNYFDLYPLPQETEKKCINQLKLTYSRVFGDEFMSEIPKKLQKMGGLSEKTNNEIKNLFHSVMS